MSKKLKSSIKFYFWHEHEGYCAFNVEDIYLPTLKKEFVKKYKKTLEYYVYEQLKRRSGTTYFGAPEPTPHFIEVYSEEEFDFIKSIPFVHISNKIDSLLDE